MPHAAAIVSAADPFALQRFVDAQHGVYAQVTAELARGAKTSHWMWFVFPQLRSLGRSATARHFGIASRAEARAYWQHALLGKRLQECAQLLLAVKGRGAEQIFGHVDAIKLRSSMTLFEAVAPEAACFAQVLDRCFAGQRDALTLDEV